MNFETNGQEKLSSGGLKVMMMVSYDKKDRPASPEPSIILGSDDFEEPGKIYP